MPAGSRSSSRRPTSWPSPPPPPPASARLAPRHAGLHEFYDWFCALSPPHFIKFISGKFFSCLSLFVKIWKSGSKNSGTDRNVSYEDPQNLWQLLIILFYHAGCSCAWWWWRRDEQQQQWPQQQWPPRSVTAGDKEGEQNGAAET